MIVQRIGLVLGMAMAAIGCSGGDGAFSGSDGSDGSEPVADVSLAVSDPGAPAPVGVTEEDYGSFTQTSSYGTNFPAVEFLGRVYYPTNLGTGRYPLVLIMHGDHQTCYSGTAAITEWPCSSGRTPIPSYQGYGYVARSLASYGMIVVSVSANGTNAVSNSISSYVERAQVFKKHYDYWARANEFNSPPFASKFMGRIDLSRVGVVGHSKGGRSVLDYASTAATRPPGLRAVLAIAPVLSSLQTPLVNAPLAILTGYCDGDVQPLAGVGYVDQARYANTDDESPKYTFLAYGGNHKYFNTFWTSKTDQGGDLDAGGGDDWTETDDPHCAPSAGRRLNGDGQRYIGRGYISGFLRKHLLDHPQFDTLLKGDELLPTAVTNGQVYVGYIPGVQDRKEINRFDLANSLITNRLGGAVRCDGVRCDQNPPTLLGTFCSGSDCKPTGTRTTHFGSLTAGKLSWSRNTPTAGRFSQALPNSNYDISNYGVLQFRVAQPPRPRDAPAQLETAQDFTIRIRDRNNLSSAVLASSYSNELYYPAGSNGSASSANKAVIMNTARIPLSAFTLADLKHAASIEFEMGQRASGSILIADMAFSDPKAYGFQAGYAGNYTYGANTSTSHGACTFSSSGQVCTIPASKTIHWCWEQSLSTASRGRISHFVPVLAGAVGKPTPLVGFTDMGFQFVAHSSCNDTAVQLIIGGAACSGTDSARMNGYVCTTFPAVTSANTLSVINERTQWPAEGSYYDWGLQNARTTLNIDLADIDRVNTTTAGLPDRDSLLTSATYHGLGWIIGLGARTDTDFLYTSRSVLPYSKGGWSSGEACRARSFRRTPDGNTFAIGVYCGPDPN